ncbi:MAG: hypothetical protein DELT_02408 [Desulfovibrio sp.]
MNDFIFDPARCTRCGACIVACGRRALVDSGNGSPALPDANYALCNACGHCSAVCPTSAVVSPKCGGERAEPLPPGLDVEYAAARKFILSCRSIRRFKEEPVDAPTVLDLLDTARRAPTASNRQELHWLALSGRDKAERFTALTMQWFDTVLRNDPVMGPRYNVDSMMARYESGDDPILRGAPNAVFCLADASEGWGCVDASIAATYFCLAAHGRGIGSCWCGFGVSALKSHAPLREFLGLRETDVVHAIVFFGYPAIRYIAYPPRKPLAIRWV